MPCPLTFLKAAVARERERERARVLARAAHDARPLPRKRGGVPTWVVWGVALPLVFVCPPVGLPLFVMLAAGERA
jgi:hypothetical protein